MQKVIRVYSVRLVRDTRFDVSLSLSLSLFSDLTKFMDVTRVVKKVFHADLIRTTLSREGGKERERERELPPLSRR